jgi:peptidoglycan/xylan/chitin deacetylase (PgdA/CDA1 family)
VKTGSAAVRFLRAAAKNGGALAFRYGGLTALVRATVHRRRVGILLYHDPPFRLLRRHLEYLSKHYVFLTLDDLVAALEARDWSRLPARGVVITFDDGYRQNLELVPLFRRYGIRPTIYVSSAAVLTSGRFWFREPAVDPEPLKTVPNAQRLAALDRLGVSNSGMVAVAERHAFEGADVKRLANIVDFQSHSVTHPILPMCSAAEAEWEIKQSRIQVESLTQRPCEHFSFPNGDYSEREIEMVKQAGYRSARTTRIGWNGRTSDPFRLKIIATPDVASVSALAAQLTGALFVKRLAQRLGLML